MTSITDERLDSMLTSFYAAEPYYPSEFTVDPALFLAAQRASRVRVTAAAASVVLASAAGAALFLSLGRGTSPVSPLPVSVTETTAPTDTADADLSPNEAPDGTAATERPSPTVRPNETTGSQTTRETTPSPTEAKNTPKPTQTATDTAQTVTLPDGTEIDGTKLNRDGKVYFTIAATAMNYIDDPAAFSDEHLMYAQTKWGIITYRIPDPLQLIDPYEPQEATPDEASPAKAYYWYYYNSDGTILRGGVVYL